MDEDEIIARDVSMASLTLIPIASLCLDISTITKASYNRSTEGPFLNDTIQLLY